VQMLIFHYSLVIVHRAYTFVVCVLQ